MDGFLVYRIALAAAGVVLLGLALWFARLRPDALPRWEPLPRNRWAGAVLGLIALLWCVPYARPIAFDWLVPLLYPLAVLGAVLGYFFLDYLLARAAGGLFILTAYYFVHAAFEFHAPLCAALSIGYWLLGIAGICLSGKPCWGRDLIRLGCRSVRGRYATAALLAALALLSFAGALQTEVKP